MRAEFSSLGAEVFLARCRQRRDRDRVGRLPHVHHPGVGEPLGAAVAGRFVGDHRQPAPRQRQRRMRAAGIGRRPGAVRQQFRLGRVRQVHHRQPARDGVVGPVAGEALAVAPGRRLAAGAVHAGQPPASDDLRLRGIGHVDRREDMVGEIVEMHRGVGVAAAHPPDAVQADALHRHEADLAGLGGVGQVEYPHAGGEVAFPLAETVGQGLAEIVARGVVALQRPDIRGIDRQQQAVMHLEVAGARVRRSGDEAHGVRRARIGDVDHADAVGEHVADIGVAARDHHLHAVRTAALVGAAQHANALRSHWLPPSWPRMLSLRECCHCERSEATSCAKPIAGSCGKQIAAGAVGTVWWGGPWRLQGGGNAGRAGCLRKDGWFSQS